MKETARITKAHFGLNPEHSLIGLFMEFETEIWAASWSKATLLPGKNSFLPRKDIDEEIIDIVNFIIDLLKAADVKELSELIGLPVEVELAGRSVVRWKPKINEKEQNRKIP
jgi:hypothetical protein